MKSIGIICEYNPFHRGHAYQLSVLRQRYPDAVLVSLMSGAFVQRGEPAVCSPYVRAEMAVSCGANLVLELPFPYSMAPAELFARGGVSILARLGVDGICFGTEGDCLPALAEAAVTLSSEAFENALSHERAAPENAAVGYPALRDRVIRAMCGAETAVLFRTPNNALAVEYLRAVRSLAPAMTPIAVPRTGDRHDGDTASAAAIRRLLRKRQYDDALTLLPDAAKDLLRAAIAAGQTTVMTPDDLLLYRYRHTPAASLAAFAGLSGGVSQRLCAAAWESTSLEEMLAAAATRKYTDAFLRRALWYGFFETTEERLKAPPVYTCLLAADGHGREFLRRHAASDEPFPVITRPSSYRTYPDAVRDAFRYAARAGTVQAMLYPAAVSPADLLRAVPRIRS